MSVITSSLLLLAATSLAKGATEIITWNNTSNGGCQKIYGQCGGQTWQGPTCCVGGTKCTFQDEYYSQCQPLPAQNCADYFGQCGGKDFSGPTSCCIASQECVWVSDYYSGCKDTDTLGQTASGDIIEEEISSTTTTTTTTSNDGCQKIFGQCGGQTWQGPTCCVGGTKCKFQDEYYSQCQPLPAQNCADYFGQCGGKDFSGPTSCCIASQECVWLSDSYSECKDTDTLGLTASGDIHV